MSFDCFHSPKSNAVLAAYSVWVPGITGRCSPRLQNTCIHKEIIKLHWCGSLWVFSFFFFFFFSVFLPFLGQLPRHMEVPRLGVSSEL